MAETFDGVESIDLQPPGQLEALQRQVSQLQLQVRDLANRLTHQTVHPLSDLLLAQPMRACVALASLFGFGILFLMFFSGMFLGPDFFLFVTSETRSENILAGRRVLAAGGMGCVVLFVLLDGHNWHKNGGCRGTGHFWQLLLGLSTLLAFILGALASVKDYPSYPLALIVLTFPLLGSVLKRCLLKEICACGAGGGDGITSQMIAPPPGYMGNAPQGGEGGATTTACAPAPASETVHLSEGPEGGGGVRVSPPKLGSSTASTPASAAPFTGDGGAPAREIEASQRRIGAFEMISKIFVLMGLASFGSWIAWMAAYDTWSHDAETRLFLGGLEECDEAAATANASLVAGAGAGASNGTTPLSCQTTFMLWVSPLILSGICIVNALVFALLALQARAEQRSQPEPSGGTRHAMRTAMFLGLSCAFLLWCAASIAGAGMRIAHDVMAIVGAAAIGLCLMVIFSAPKAAASEGPASASSAGRQITLRIGEGLRSQWAQALLVFMGTVPLIGYFCFASVRQLVRRCGRGACMCDKPDVIEVVSRFGGLEEAESETKPPPPRQRAALIDATSRALWSHIKATPGKTQVLQKVQLLCFATWAMLFGSTLTFVALAAMIAWLSTLSKIVVVFLFLAMGIVMFLIPVVPGLAVYLTGGIAIVQIFEPVFGELVGSPDGGFYLAVAFASALSFVMKLAAHVLQQVIFGECMGKSVSVRAIVGVNSSVIKAIKFELIKPGVSLSKVCIMCGGPDWPTSVLCGILRRSDAEAKVPMRIKTCELLLCLGPMVLLIGPTTLAAAFQLKTGDPYAAIASVSLICCSLVQVAAFAIATSYINKAMSDPRCQELIEREVDTKVAEYEQAVAEESRRFARASVLSQLSCAELLSLVLGSLLLTLSAYALIFASSYCFVDFNLATDSLSDFECIAGCERAFIKLPGLIVLGFLAVGVVLNRLFDRLIRRRLAGKGADTNAAPV
jgi:hypothetical protein